MRPTKDEYYLDIAKSVAARSTCLRRNYGAIIVKDDAIVSTGYNGAPRGDENCDDRGICKREELKIPHGERYELCASVHAEANAVINAARNGVSVLGGTLYIYGYDCIEDKTITARPCKMCMRVIQNAGIARVLVSQEVPEWEGECNYCGNTQSDLHGCRGEHCNECKETAERKGSRETTEHSGADEASPARG